MPHQVFLEHVHRGLEKMQREIATRTPAVANRKIGRSKSEDYNAVLAETKFMEAWGDWIRSAATSLMMYTPKNAAERALKNKYLQDLKTAHKHLAAVMIPRQYKLLERIGQAPEF